ncbi:MAG: multicopper oxidase domain-containing protein, partial [Casimicrobiaceae bacterium]
NVFDQKYKPFDKATSTQFGNQQWPGNAIYPGGRHSVIVKASDVPGTYFLRSVQAPSSETRDEIVARIVVEGVPISTAVPSPANLPRYPDHEPITDQELASHGGKQRNLVLAILKYPNDVLAQPIPAGEDWFIPAQDNVPDFTDFVFASGTVGAKLSPFQSSLTVTQTVALNAVEEWTIENMNVYPHPFHIHINDSYVIKVNGEPVPPFWCDTIPVPPKDFVNNKNGSITFRMRFTDYIGKFVWHCHALDHEDLGMMQLVEVVQ